MFAQNKLQLWDITNKTYTYTILTNEFEKPYFCCKMSLLVIIRMIRV